MESLVAGHAVPDREGVALKAFSRIAEAWALTTREAAGLADMTESTWKRARKPGFAGGLPKILRVRAYVDALRGGM